ncbi:MAG TPA: hypothetical protein VL049_10100, partial [Candidatus Dormibacteraeota bacterium]|nr:hypothetical protein [Candidatus Dormibacteraeota bacterium]
MKTIFSLVSISRPLKSSAGRRRIGVDQNSRPGLITHRLSRWTRNPICLAMFVAFSGFLLMTPRWLTLPALLGSAIAVRSQVREEYAYLLRTYGDEFRRYAASAASFPAWGCSSIPSASTS